MFGEAEGRGSRTASIGEPGSVNTATEYDHIHSAYNANDRNARNQPIKSVDGSELWVQGGKGVT
jgi:hypothetical protein